MDPEPSNTNDIKGGTIEDENMSAVQMRNRK